MIKVILPTGNSNNFKIVTDTVLKDVCNRIFGTKTFTKESEHRKDGQYFKVINTEKNEIHFVAFNNKNDSRNTRLVQPFPVVYADFFYCKEKNKHLDIYFINPQSSDNTPYAHLFYRCFLTIGVNLLNPEILNFNTLSKFTDYYDLKRFRNKNREANKGNHSSYFIDDDNKITFYGKNDGVNSKESFILSLTVLYVTEKPIVYYSIKNNISAKYKPILEAAGINFKPTLQTLTTGRAKPTNNEIRNQEAFKYNLLEKFGGKFCYLCGCDLEHLVIASHIERITDIKNNSNYLAAEKALRAVDGDNGLWLCANHDKMFEFGQIFFEENILQTKLVEQDNIFFEKSIYEVRNIYFEKTVIEKPFKIDKEHYNSKMADYLQKHFQRVK